MYHEYDNQLGLGATPFFDRLNTFTSRLNQSAQQLAPAISNVKSTIQAFKTNAPVALPGGVAYNPTLTTANPLQQPAPAKGMSLGKKVAIGAGIALAAFGVYKVATKKKKN